MNELIKQAAARLSGGLSPRAAAIALRCQCGASVAEADAAVRAAADDEVRLLEDRFLDNPAVWAVPGGRRVLVHVDPTDDARYVATDEAGRYLTSATTEQKIETWLTDAEREWFQ